MTELLLQTNQIVSALTLTATLAFIVFVVFWLADRLGFKSSYFETIEDYLREFALPLSFIVTLGSALGSLYYSNVLGYEPCALCWWARVFIFPQAFILALAWPKNNRAIFSYLLPLSFLGTLAMIYNQGLQMGWFGPSSVICGIGKEASCSVRYVFEYGFITIPMMALIAFLWLIVLGFLGQETEKKEVSKSGTTPLSIPRGLHEVVLAAVIVKDGKYLITRRSPNKELFPGKWTIPGGRLEMENYRSLPKDTEHHWYNILERILSRQIKEKINIDIKNIEYISSLSMAGNNQPSLIISCLAQYAGGEIKLDKSENDDYIWATLSEIKNYNLVDGVYNQLIMAERQLQSRKG